MSRLPLLPEQPQDASARKLFDRVRAAMGADFQMPALYRTLAHAPEMFQAWLDFAWPLRQRAKTPRKLRELMIMRGAQVSATAYEWAHHLPMALAAGVSEAQIEELARWRQSPHFDSRERAVLQMVEEVTQGPCASAASIEQLKQEGFDHEAVVELVLTASFYVCVGRFLQSMGIEPEAAYASQTRGM